MHLDIAYPDVAQLNRVLPLIKWLLAIPHYIVLTVLGAVAVVIAVFSWIAILVTGQQPKWAFDRSGSRSGAEPRHALGRQSRSRRHGWPRSAPAPERGLVRRLRQDAGG